MASSEQDIVRARSFHRAWYRVPPSLRRIAGRFLNRVGVSGWISNWMRDTPQTKDFFTMTPETPPAILKCLQQVAVEGSLGDYYEFGMYRGYTFWYAQRSANKLGLKLNFYGFDSFQGVPQPEPDEVNEFKKGDYACSREQVERHLRMAGGVDWTRTHLIEGFYENSLQPALKAQLNMGPVAVALIDCDLYQSTLHVLRFLDSLLQDGSILMFDDWNCFNQSDEQGERRAFREFLEQHPQWRSESFVSFGWHGQSFVLRQNNKGE